jgi:hypothetical protein
MRLIFAASPRQAPAGPDPATGGQRGRHVWTAITCDSLPDRWYRCPGRIASIPARKVTCSACGKLEPGPAPDGEYWVAPWDLAQVKALADWQSYGVMHPYTCGGWLHEERGEPPPVLVPGADGWACPDRGCAYRQNWAHAAVLQHARLRASALAS